MLNTKKTVNVGQLFLAVILLTMTYIIYKADFSSMSYLGLCYLVIVDIVLCGLMFVQSKRARLEDARFLFWIITTLFSFGQNIAYIFISNDTSTYSILYNRQYSFESMLEGTVFTVLAYNFLSFGLALSLRGNSFEETEKRNENVASYRKYAPAMFFVSRVLLVVSFVPQIIYMYTEIALFMSKGYGYSATESLSGLVLIFHYWFIPSIIISYIAKTITDKKPIFETTVIVIVALMFMFIGDRGSSLSILLVLIFLRCIFNQGKKRTIYIWSIVIVLLIPFIKFFRIAFEGGTSLALGEAFDEMLKTNPLIEMLLELGGSQKIIIMTIQRVAVEGLAYGTAYLDFFIKMLPSFFGVSMFYPTLAKWVIGTSGYQTKGFSIWGEAYLNFGNWGIPFMFVIGKILGLMLGVKKNDSALKIAFAAITLYFFADVSRRSISEFGFVFLYNIIIPVLAISFFANVKWRRKESINE